MPDPRKSKAEPEYIKYERAADIIKKRARLNAMAKGKKGSTGLSLSDSIAQLMLLRKAGKLREKAMYGKKENK